MTTTARISHSYTVGQHYFAVETSMNEALLNKAIAFIQYVRNDLPIMEIQYNDCVAEPDCIFVLERVFACRQIPAEKHTHFDVTVDLHRNWDLVYSFDYADLNVSRQTVAAALLDVFLLHANEIIACRGATDQRRREFGYLCDLRAGKPAMPEWRLNTIVGEPFVGSIV